jgi:predicted enzyme related to lactoylglutathione lyase
MKNKIWFAALLSALASSMAQADTLLATRIVADDVPALAKFYETVFDMKQVNRFDMQNGMKEIMLNFGETVEAAKANRAATQLVISSKQPGEGQDNVAHLVFSVTDMAATIKKFKAAGGRFAREPQSIGTSKTQMAIGTDPVGNQVEVLWLEPRK